MNLRSSSFENLKTFFCAKPYYCCAVLKSEIVITMLVLSIELILFIAERLPLRVLAYFPSNALVLSELMKPLNNNN